MNAIIRAVDRLNQFIGLSVAHLYLICVAITIYEVAMRYLFDSPTQWAFEVVMVVCASAWVLSGGYLAMRRSHIAITVVYERTKGRVRWYLELFILLVSIATMFTFAYALWEPMEDAVTALERSGTSFNSPEPMILKTLLFVAAVLYGVQLVVNLVKLISGYSGSKQDSLSEN